MIIIENSALVPVRISAKISHKPQTRFWVPRFQNNSRRQYMGRWTKWQESLFFPSGKAYSSMVFLTDHYLCAHYQWLLLGSRTKGGRQGTFTFHLLYSVWFFATCNNFTNGKSVQHLQIAQHCSERKDIVLSEKDIHPCHHTYNKYWKSPSGFFF